MVTLSLSEVLSFGQDLPIVRELQAVFEALDDESLLQVLNGPTRRGPKGYPAKTLFCCFVAKHYMGLESTASLLRTLKNNPFIAAICGLTPDKGIPSEPTMSRFFKRLSSKYALPRLKDVSRSLVRRYRDTLPGFGQRVAMDATTLGAWSNGAKAKKSDRQAGWSVKLNTHGKTEFTYGWKLHLLVDTEYGGLPLGANVTAGNLHDSTRATNLLSEARFTLNHFKARYIMADAGYSSDKLRRYVQRWYGEPIFDAPKGHKKAYQRNSNNPKFAVLKRLRGAVERTFSQLKRTYCLNQLRVRGRMKVTTHIYLSLLALQAARFVIDSEKTETWVRHQAKSQAPVCRPQ